MTGFVNACMIAGQPVKEAAISQDSGVLPFTIEGSRVFGVIAAVATLLLV
jgi:hypothetical protein